MSENEKKELQQEVSEEKIVEKKQDKPQKNDKLQEKAKKEAKAKAMAQKTAKWFRELKSEAKKVVWPSRKQVLNNTGVVLVVCVIVGAFIALIDFLFQAAILDGLLALITGY